jgi:hypothetical protein
MAIDLFDPRTMGQMLEERKAPRTFVRDTFFSNRQPRDTEFVDFDVETKVRKLAPFSSLKLAGRVMDDDGFVTKTFTPPLVNPKKITTAEQLQKRVAGEPIYGGMSPDERASQKLGKDLGELDDMIIRREELMCIEAVFDGQVTVIGEGVDAVVSFSRPAGNVIALPAAAQRWSAGTADIPKDLRDWRRICVKQCGVAPDVGILGSEVADALLNNSGLRAMLDTMRLDLGQISPEILAMPGVTYLGRLKGTGIDLYSYDEWYVDPTDGVEKAMVPAKKVLLGSTQARTELAYGAVPVALGEGSGSTITMIAGERVPESWTNKEPAARFVKVSSRPLPIPIQIGAFLVATVIA